MTGNKKKIGIQLPRQANPEEVAIRYSLELEARGTRIQKG